MGITSRPRPRDLRAVAADVGRQFRDTEAIVAGAVPILERPRWPPAQALHGFARRAAPLSNDTAWASVGNDPPSHRFAATRASTTYPYWLYHVVIVY